MDLQQSTLSEILNQFDERLDGFPEFEMASPLGNLIIRCQDSGETPSPALKAEWAAWGYSFGPLHSWELTGELRESAKLQELTHETIAYWTSRARESKHPLFRLRYGGLVWEIAPRVPGASRPVEMAYILLDSAVELSRRGLGNADVNLISILRWALSVAVSVNDSIRIAAMRDAVMALEDRIAQDNLPGLWGFSFDLLLENQKTDVKKIAASIEQRKKIIDDLESRLTRLSTNDDLTQVDPHHIEGAALRLARYYRKQSQPEEVKRVLNIYAAAYLWKAKVSSAMLAAAWLRTVHETLLSFQLKDVASTILPCYSAYAKKAMNEMPSHHEKITLDPEKVQSYLRSITEGDWNTVFSKVIGCYLPRRKDIEQQLQERVGDPLLALFPITLVDREGRAVDLGTLENDMESNVIHHIAEEIQFQGQHLHWVMQELVGNRGLSSAVILDYLYQSFIFDERKRLIIEGGLNAYFAGHWLAAIHILIPQIENAVRRLVERTGGTIHKKHNRSDAVMLKTLDELLREEMVTRAYSNDGAIYLRVVLTDPRGLNIRNDVCHGVPPVEFFNPGIAHRLLHVLLLLGTVRGDSSKHSSEPAPDEPHAANGTRDA